MQLMQVFCGQDRPLEERMAMVQLFPREKETAAEWNFLPEFLVE
jgi:hypothetical protein